MNYSAIKQSDIANGDGVRVSLFVSGCTHRCKGCFNEIAWDFDHGESFDDSVEDKILLMLSRDYISGLSLLGGEPFEPSNQIALLPLIRRFKAKFPSKTIWGYTGYIYDVDLVDGGRAHCSATDEILNNVDVLVDGPFVENLKDISLPFRGSSNQRIIRLREKSGVVVAISH